MRGGLIRLSEPAFTSVASLEGLTNDGVRTATVGNDGSVWVATGHALNRFSGSAHRSLDVSQTMALHSDRHGTLWIAAAQKISRLVGSRLEDIPIPDEIRTSRVMALTTDSQDTLVDLHRAQGRDDVGRQDRFALHEPRRHRRQGLSVDLHRQPGPRLDRHVDGWRRRSRQGHVPYLWHE